MLTTRPCCSAARYGTARRTRWAWAVRLTASVRSQLVTKSSSSCWENVGQGDAGVVDEDVEAAETLDDGAHEAAQLAEVADVGDDADRRVGAVGVGDLGDDGVDGVLAEVDDGDAGALVGEQVGGRPAHAAGRAGDDGPLAGDRSGQVGEAHPPTIRAGSGRSGSSAPDAAETAAGPGRHRRSLPPQGSREPRRGAGTGCTASLHARRKPTRGARPPARNLPNGNTAAERCNGVAPIPGRRGGLIEGGASPPPPTERPSAARLAPRCCQRSSHHRVLRHARYVLARTFGNRMRSARRDRHGRTS